MRCDREDPELHERGHDERDLHEVNCNAGTRWRLEAPFRSSRHPTHARTRRGSPRRAWTLRSCDHPEALPYPRPGRSAANRVRQSLPAEDTEADVSTLFAQVAVDQPLVDWSGNCGNLTSAVGVCALDAGLVEPTEPTTVVRIMSRNTGLRVHAHIPTRDGRLAPDGNFEIPGVPGRCARIDLEWLEPSQVRRSSLCSSANSLHRGRRFAAYRDFRERAARCARALPVTREDRSREKIRRGSCPRDRAGKERP